MAELTTELVEKETVQYIVVKIGDEQYGIDISFVDNIVRMQKITRVPSAPFHYLGVINLRGEVVPVMSVRRKMDLEDDEFTNSSRIIILKIENHGLIGIVVDSVNVVRTLSEDDIDRTPQAKKDANFVLGVGKSEGELISIFDLSAIIDEADAS